jgi:hypothetical protein
MKVITTSIIRTNRMGSTGNYPGRGEETPSLERHHHHHLAVRQARHMLARLSGCPMLCPDFLIQAVYRFF